MEWKCCFVGAVRERRKVILGFIAGIAMSVSAEAQLPGDSHWFFDYGGPSSEPFGIERAGEYLYCFGGFLNLEGDIDKKNLARFHLKREQWERVPGISQFFTNFIRDAFADGQGNLFICGDFSSVNGVTAKRVARFDLATETWHALEDASLPEDDRFGPSGGGAYAVVRSGDYVYLGGFLFESPNNVGMRYVRRYNLTTSRWSSVGAGLNDTVRSFAAAPDGRVFAGGSFTARGDGSGSISGVAVWDGNNWQPVGGGVTGDAGDVRAISLGPGARMLAVGGQFNSAGGNACAEVAVYDTVANSWDTLDGGIRGGGNVRGVYGLEIAPDGTLYICGDFDEDSRGNVLNKVGYWDGSGTWSTMGSGLGRSSTQIVNGLEVVGESVYFAGVFARGWTAPNDQPNFARWELARDFDGYIPGLPWLDCSMRILPDPDDPATKLRIEHASRAGQTYVIQGSSSAVGGWVDVGAPFTASRDGSLFWTINRLSVPSQFYRIRVQD